MNYSVTQGTNFATFAGALTIIIRLLQTKDLSTLTEAEWEILIGAVFVLGSAAVSFINRYRKGDVTLGGFKKA